MISVLARRILGPLLLVAFIGVALLLDIMLPDGFSANVLYLVPIVLAPVLGLGSPLLWAFIGTGLSLFASLMAPPGLAPVWEIADRALTIGVLWVVTILVGQIEHQKQRARVAQALAEQANLRKSRFLAAASHDLRQPAHSLTLLSSVLQQRAAGTPLESVVLPIEQSIAALNGMLSGLLELSRLDAGILKPEIADLDVLTLVARLEKEYTLQAGEKGLRFRARCRTAGIIRTDPQFLERILRNLLDNAVKYTSSGFVSLGCVRRGGVWLFQVSDTGVGIPPRYRQAIFDEFFQIDNDERDRAKGFGIGLSVVARLVQILGGRLRLWSKEGRGSRFTIVLPAVGNGN